MKIAYPYPMEEEKVAEKLVSEFQLYHEDCSTDIELAKQYSIESINQLGNDVSGYWKKVIYEIKKII